MLTVACDLRSNMGLSGCKNWLSLLDCYQVTCLIQPNLTLVFSCLFYVVMYFVHWCTYAFEVLLGLGSLVPCYMIG